MSRALQDATVFSVRIRCPICQKELEAPDDFPPRPFCSARCKKIDLGNWLDEKYRLSRPLDPEDLEEYPEALEAVLKSQRFDVN